MRERLEKLLSRKFLVAMSCWASTTVFLALDKIDGSQYVSLVGLILGLFGAANGAVHVFSKKEDDA